MTFRLLRALERTSLAPLVLLAALLAGCAGERLPRYTWTSREAAVADLAARGEKVQTLSGTASITLARPGGERVSFDSAVVAELPKRFRIRAWKFGQAIFDLTVTPEGVWLEKSARVPKDRVWPPTLTPDRFAWGWRMITSQALTPAATEARSGDGLVRLQQPLENGLALTTELDPSTLTVRQHQVRDAEGKLRFGLRQERYRVFGDIVWPTRIVARSDQGTITIHFEELELNMPLASTAFVPPRRAERLQ